VHCVGHFYCVQRGSDYEKSSHSSQIAALVRESVYFRLNEAKLNSVVEYSFAIYRMKKGGLVTDFGNNNLPNEAHMRT
jgi:hypothetical protein